MWSAKPFIAWALSKPLSFISKVRSPASSILAKLDFPEPLMHCDTSDHVDGIKLRTAAPQIRTFTFTL